MSEIFKTVPISHFVYLCTVLFTIGVVGVLTQRNALIIFMSVELMLNAVNLMLVSFSAYRHDPAGQIFIFFVMAVAAAEVAVGLAIITMIYRNIHSVDINQLSRLKG